MSFHERSIHERISGLAGKPAENAFELVMAERGRIVGQQLFRFGFDQVDTRDGAVATFPRVMRHTPDYISVGGHLYEVQGCGNDRTLTFKKEKLEDMLKWAEFAGRELRWAFFIQADDCVLFATMDAVISSLSDPRTTQTILDPDTQNPKEAWRVPVEVFYDTRVRDCFAADRKVGSRG
jgi:hypothetical protein